jgi:coproporphyrinogen III oxidase-like Fe-S oxidoreductase
LSKGNTYPPILAADGLPHAQVQAAWADLAGRIRAGDALETIGIYLHVPWCASICKFCYCYKNLLEKPEILDAYVDAVIDQAAAVAPLLKGIRMRSLYVGGGTPSVLSAAQMERLFGALYGMFEFMEGHQFNIEGTPATLARGDRVATLARLGVTRLTIGVQSLERHLLEHMNRTQSGPQVIEEVVQSARAHGIKHINMDLMAGLPEQTFEDWERSIEELVRWRPDVIHVYPFQPTHETTYYKEGFRVTPEIEALRTRMLEHAEKVLRTEGWKDVPHDSYALSLEARNQQDVDKIVNAASILPLGYNARGHVFGALSYGTLEAGFKQYMEDRSKADFYYGLPVSLEDDMVRWTISNLMTGIDRERFHAIFGVDIVERFPAQLRWLQERGLIDVQLTRIVSKMETSAESVVWSKLFFADKYHEMLRERFKDEYKPEVDWVEEWRKMYAQGF